MHSGGARDSQPVPGICDQGPSTCFIARGTLQQMAALVALLSTKPPAVTALIPWLAVDDSGTRLASYLEVRKV